MKLTDKLNVRIHSLMAWRLRSYYRRELKAWERQHPEAFGKVSDDLARQYKELWGRLVPRPYDGWLRLLTHLSGKMDFRFVPADAYYSVIERCLNNCNSTGGIDDKNIMSLYAPDNLLPKVILRYIRGVFFDVGFNAVTRVQAAEILQSYEGDVVGKPATDTSGGTGVFLFSDRGGGRKYHGETELTVDWMSSKYETYVVQERVLQEPVASSLNPHSVNTCRIVTFRRPWSAKTSVLCAMLRVGSGTEIVDNISSGGFCADVSEDGFLASSGVDHDFGFVDRAATTGVEFAGIRLPGFDNMCAAACEVAARVPDFNILGFDVVSRPDGSPCILEVNTSSIASIMIQMGHPLFGEETEQVVDWCEKNRRFDFFRHIRTFY